MSDVRAARFAWPAAVLAVVLIAGSTTVFTIRVPGSLEVEGIVVDLAFAAFAIVGAVIASKQPRNLIGRLFLLMGLAAGVAIAADNWVRSIPPLPGRQAVAILVTPVFLAGFLPLIAVLLMFPDGTLLSRRWRLAVWLAVGAGTLVTIGPLLSPTFVDYPGLDNPIGMDWVAGSPLEDGGIGWPLLMVAFVVAASAPIIRYRRSETDERRRIKWLMAGAVFVAIGWVLQSIGYDIHSGLGAALRLSFFVAILAFPLLVGIAIVRRRLYDIDVVINRTLVYGALATFITVVYVAIVVGIGTLVGAGDEPNAGLQIAATALVAVAFQPVRRTVQRVANRLVFGERATPYEVMTDFAERIAGTLAVEDALPQIAEATARGIGASSATIRLFLPSGGERSVTWPPVGGDEAAGPGETRAIDIVHAGERLGSLTVTKRPGENIAPGEESLLDDVAAQAGLALRNVRLTLELQDRLRTIEEQAEQLRRSRQRLVTARDVQRKRLERDIREGAQQQLERIGGRLREASDLLERDPHHASTMLEQVEAETGSALERLRDLARGIFPPLLADEGIAAALEAHLRKLSIPGTLSIALNGARFDAEVEAAVYFCCVQALQNAVRHAPGSSVEVSVERDDDDLVFVVRDDGEGFEPARAPRGMGLDIMHDRMEALGGTLEVTSTPGRGTTVTGRVPVRALQEAAS